MGRSTTFKSVVEPTVVTASGASGALEMWLKTEWLDAEGYIELYYTA